MVNRGASAKMVIRSKKGIFFTVTVIIILSLFLITYTFYIKFADRSVIQERVSTLNNFIFSTEEDLQRQLYIAGFRALFIIQKEVIEQGSYVSDVNATFQELFFAGTLNGAQQPIMAGATFSDIQTAIQQKAAKVNADIDLLNPVLQIKQTSPWYVDISLIVNFNAQDQGGLVRWNKTEIFTAQVPIEEFEDPLYLINTNGLVTNKIKKTPFTTFVTGQSVTNLNNHTINSYYINSTTSPGYLKRLAGDTAPDLNGIESLVYIPKLSNQGVSTLDKTVVDYIYFSSNNPIKCQISGMPSWFKLDQPHLAAYQATGLEYNCQ